MQNNRIEGTILFYVDNQSLSVLFLNSHQTDSIGGKNAGK